MPPIIIFMPRGSASGTGWFLSFEPGLHQADLGRLAERDAAAEDLKRLARAVRLPPNPAIFTACAWWAIMPDMKAMSAAV